MQTDRPVRVSIPGATPGTGNPAAGVRPGTPGVALGFRVPGVCLDGELQVPRRASAIVVLANGTARSPDGIRDGLVARRLHGAGLATLRTDLLIEPERRIDRRSGAFRLDADLLARRLVAIVDWLGLQARTRRLPIGLFGTGTCAGAALVTAAARPNAVQAVVSLAGRPDLAGDELTRVRAPALLLVGELDQRVLELNQRALRPLADLGRLHVLPDTDRGLRTPEAVELVGHLAADWFGRYLGDGEPWLARRVLGGWH